jgi:hypothetical protein
MLAQALDLIRRRELRVLGALRRLEALGGLSLAHEQAAAYSGANSAAWTIIGSAAGWTFAASSMASAKVFATVKPSWYSAGAWRVSSSSRARGRLEARVVLSQGDVEPFAVGRRLLVRER